MRMKKIFLLAASFSLLGLTGAASSQQFSRANGLVNEAAHALDRGHWSRGMGLAKQALKSGDLMPQNVPAAYNNLCIGLNGMGRFDEAMDACNRAINMRPREWSFYNNRANIHFYRQHYSQALSDYYKALTFSPGDDVLLGNISLALRSRKTFGEREQQAAAEG